MSLTHVSVCTPPRLHAGVRTTGSDTCSLLPPLARRAAPSRPSCCAVLPLLSPRLGKPWSVLCPDGSASPRGSGRRHQTHAGVWLPLHGQACFRLIWAATEMASLGAEHCSTAKLTTSGCSRCLAVTRDCHQQPCPDSKDTHFPFSWVDT